MPSADPHTLARTVVERCWSEPAGVERMRGLLADGYVHHSPGDPGVEFARACSSFP